MNTLTKIIAILVLIILLGSLGLNGYQYFHTSSLEKQITSLTTDNNTLKTNLKSANDQIAAQNKSITDANKQAQNDQNKINDLSKTITDMQNQNATLVKQIKNIPVPKDCNAAVEYLNKYKVLLQW